MLGFSLFCCTGFHSSLLALELQSDESPIVTDVARSAFNTYSVYSSYILLNHLYLTLCTYAREYTTRVLLVHQNSLR